jgi:hypothetical protein
VLWLRNCARLKFLAVFHRDRAQTERVCLSVNRGQLNDAFHPSDRFGSRSACRAYVVRCPRLRARGRGRGAHRFRDPVAMQVHWGQGPSDGPVAARIRRLSVEKPGPSTPADAQRAARSRVYHSQKIHIPSVMLNSADGSPRAPCPDRHHSEGLNRPRHERLATTPAAGRSSCSRLSGSVFASAGRCCWRSPAGMSHSRELRRNAS